MQTLELQGLFAPFVATLAGATLLLLWHFNRSIRYLPYFAFSLFAFSAAVVLSQFVFEKMTVPNANPGLYLPMALAVTFPVNITIGMPLYLLVIQSF